MQAAQTTYPTTKTQPKSAPATQVVINTGMTLEEARQEQWEILYGPTTGAKGTMGELIDRKQMDIINLAYTIKKARNQRHVNAAITLLANELGQPHNVEDDRRYGPQVHSSGYYLEDQQDDSLIGWAVIASGGASICAMILFSMMWTAAERLLQGYNWLVTLVPLVTSIGIVVGPASLLTYKYASKEFRKYKSIRGGREGEEWATDVVRTTLDNRWTAFRNIKLPGRKDDLDLILVGPPGVWVLEVKSYKAPTRVQFKKWSYLQGKKWQALDSNPIAQVRNNAVQLRYFIEKYGLKQHISAAVVLTKPQQISNFEPTEEPIWFQFALEKHLTELNTLPERLHEAERTTIVAELTKLSEADKNMV